jgi:N-formylglutamate amidohydrolase
VWPIVRDVLSVYEANVVRGLMPRKFVDYNRPEWEAFELQQFRSTHEAYHGRIFRELRQMQLHHGLDAFLLLDIHGFGVQPPYAPREGYDLILGTGNRTTIAHGDVDQELAHFLEACGYNVFLPSHEIEHPPHERMNGGFTVRSFAREFKVNAIQLEIAPRFRKRDSAMLGTKLSQDLGEFLSERYKV